MFSGGGLLWDLKKTQSSPASLRAGVGCLHELEGSRIQLEHTGGERRAGSAACLCSVGRLERLALN